MNFAELVQLGDDAVREQLVQIHGIGPWTADIFVMFAIGRADARASGDLALQVAAGRVLGLEAKPTAVELTEIAVGGPGAALLRDCYGPTTPTSRVP